MKTIIFKTASVYLLPLLLLFSVFILLRGHYLPGGGFVGGLMASTAFVIHSFANGVERTKNIVKFHPGFLMPVGLALALLAGSLPLFLGETFMTGLWMDQPVPVIGSVGTALFFDTGVYLVVIGVTLTIIFTISEGL
ncbi:multisubunit sodium/proton antiporter, MrpB subunit [Cyclobacterium xiamenense]|uniref:Multisubunit sodium/proton antiporter, MrpB subunit n=1 Tax=Cyclobacterium xiamenense TaxID=1297121 RepID=A0A1H7BRF8_9BACT|nr:Na+/H+ antiporter subunit B [Cyclobacterium xiamenense]SEJ76880.1 multisubunit sodium/proton antiporter, MrpB subunit [Cyclobacterium xiamenense]